MLFVGELAMAREMSLHGLKQRLKIQQYWLRVRLLRGSEAVSCLNLDLESRLPLRKVGPLFPEVVMTMTEIS